MTNLGCVGEGLVGMLGVSYSLWELQRSPAHRAVSWCKVVIFTVGTKAGVQKATKLGMCVVGKCNDSTDLDCVWDNGMGPLIKA